MMARVVTVAFEGVEARRVDVEVQVSNSSLDAAFFVVGLADKAVTESRERVRAAFAGLGLALPKRITVNLAPADTKKEGSHYDLPIALGLMCAMGVLPMDSFEEWAAVGELSLGAEPPADAHLSAGLRQLAAGEITRTAFLERFGHRGTNEMELSQPRWAEAPEQLDLVTGSGQGFSSHNVGGLDAWDRIATDAKLRGASARASAELAQEMRWASALEPLVAFCRAPHRAPDLVSDDFPPVPPGDVMVRWWGKGLLRHDLEIVVDGVRRGQFRELGTRAMSRMKRLAQ